jgi:hypothetical protein
VCIRSAGIRFVQYSRNFRLRHAITVLGRTINSAFRHPFQTRECQDQGMRSAGRIRGRLAIGELVLKGEDLNLQGRP